MRRMVSRAWPLSLVLLGLGCVEHVSAVAVSDQPFTIPGIDGEVCVVSLHWNAEWRTKERRSSGSFRPDVFAAPGTRLMIEGRTVVDPVLEGSRGWEQVPGRYAWYDKDEDRAPPPDHLLELFTYADESTQDAIAQVICDGNAYCGSGGHLNTKYRNLREFSASLRVIRCGVEFEAPRPED